MTECMMSFGEMPGPITVNIGVLGAVAAGVLVLVVVVRRRLYFQAVAAMAVMASTILAFLGLWRLVEPSKDTSDWVIGGASLFGAAICLLATSFGIARHRRKKRGQRVRGTQ